MMRYHGVLEVPTRQALTQTCVPPSPRAREGAGGQFADQTHLTDLIALVASYMVTDAINHEV